MTDMATDDILSEQTAAEAGPSDWYRRSTTPTSPPPDWRRPSLHDHATQDRPFDMWASDSPRMKHEFQSSRATSVQSSGTSDQVHPADVCMEKAGNAAEARCGDDESDIVGQRVRTDEGFPLISQSPAPSFASASEFIPSGKAPIPPAVSRLRSHHRSVSSLTLGSVRPLSGHSRTPSQLSQLPKSITPVDPCITFYPLRQLSVAVKGSQPTAFDVRGVIALGTHAGHVFVYTFAQELSLTLSTETTLQSGPVTALRISADQTYIAVGHGSGNIHLWDLASPGKPARTVIAASQQHLLSGWKDGHARGNAIEHVNFVGSRHTAIISGDSSGRVFWWSLGRIVRLESTDVIRILGGNKRSSLLAALPLPLGEEHPIDESQVAALLNPRKLVIVRLKPSPKTLHRRIGKGSTGCAAWLPAGEHGRGSDPVLAYAWDECLHFLRVPSFVESRPYFAASCILALHWFDPNHVLVVLEKSILLIDVRANVAVEEVPFTANVFLSSTVYKQRIFVLTRTSLQAGSVQYWNEKILACVHRGDFLGAVQRAIGYYNGTDPGNTINLPQRSVIADRIRELVTASLKWAFSEDRMRDDTHFSADGRGVDLTDIFEALVVSTIEASLAIDDILLLADAYETYEAVGIRGIFLNQVQSLDSLSRMPTPIVKALLDFHAERGDFNLAEHIIWSANPESLDINQAVTLCEKQQLWDALVHVYNRALHDFTTPIAKLLGPQVDTTAVYAYLEAILSGVSFPTAEPLPQPSTAQAAVYEAILGDYFPHLLSNTELFLHVLDLAFEQSFLNDSSTSRQVIVNMLLAESSDLFVYIFVARNLPKYPQFITLPPSTLAAILNGLSKGERDTLEDRQLAVEYLLSAYKPHDIDETLQLFKKAGFNRILARHYRERGNWKDLALLHLQAESTDIFDILGECFSREPSASAILADYLARITFCGIRETASLIDTWIPSLHSSALGGLADTERLEYFACLLEPDHSSLTLDHKHQYLALLRQYRPQHVVEYLDGAKGIDPRRVAAECERDGHTPGFLWALHREGGEDVFRIAGQLIREQGADVCESTSPDDTDYRLARLLATSDMVVLLARQHPSEATWFEVLHPLIDVVQAISTSNPTISSRVQQTINSTLQELIPSGTSLPRLVRRLIDETSAAKTAHAEFRSVLAALVESYRLETEILSVGRSLMDEELFLLVEVLTRSKQQGVLIVGNV